LFKSVTLRNGSSLDLGALPGGVGGGPYDDENVSDEFYWAAAELFITTKKPVYKDFVTKSPHYKQVPVNATASAPARFSFASPL
jgi:endoglucanase